MDKFKIGSKEHCDKCAITVGERLREDNKSKVLMVPGYNYCARLCIKHYKQTKLVCDGCKAFIGIRTEYQGQDSEGAEIATYCIECVKKIDIALK